GIAAVLGNGLLEVFRRLYERTYRPPVEEIEASQVQVVRVEVRGGGFHCHQLALQRIGDGAGDILLQSEEALQLAVVRLRPDVVVISHVDELGGDPQAVALSTDAALEQSADAQLFADSANAEVLPFKGKRRSAGRNSKPLHIGERIN